MKVPPHTGLLWLFLIQPTGGAGAYAALLKPCSDSVSVANDDAELPIATTTVTAGNHTRSSVLEPLLDRLGLHIIYTSLTTHTHTHTTELRTAA